MATLTSSPRPTNPDLLSTAEMWLPRASLANCLRGVFVRNTMDLALSDAQRVSYFPVSPFCSLSWTFHGAISRLAEPPGKPELDLVCPRHEMPGRWVLSGPQTRPLATWSPGAAHGMAVIFMPDALHHLIGVEPADLLDRYVDASTLLPPDWLAMCQAVQDAPDDAQRLEIFETFLDPRWQACRPSQSFSAHRFADWASHLAQRAALSGPGRSARQLERRVKQWSGLPMRELRGMGRAEQTFFNTLDAHEEGALSWTDIAADNGFSDQAHFCRTVRRVTGFSPEAVRQGIENDERFWAYRGWM